VDVTITDPLWKSDEYNFAERWVLKLMRDERDMIFVRTATKLSLSVFPLVVILFLSPPWLVACLAVPYLGFVMGVFGARYGLMLHAVGHRPVFKKKYRYLDNYIPWFLGPLLGHTPTSFEAHHVWMHHAENNMLGDGSSTLWYVRDKFTHFLHYWARFFFVGYINLSRYLLLRGRRKVWMKWMIGEVIWYLGAAGALWLNWAAALLVFIVPMLLMRWLVMAGNFGQHAFVDLDDPDNGFKNSTNLTNTRYNHKAYNDGYHIVHHLFAGMHWSEMPQWYLDNLDKFAEQDAIVFDGISDNQQVWWLLMTHNYDKLAKHLVNFKNRTHEEKVAFLQARARRQLAPVTPFFHIETTDDMRRTARQVAA